MPTAGPGLEIDQGPQGLCAGTFPPSATSRAAFDSGEHVMTHVLIVVSFLGGAVQGAVVSTQEYSSAERCEAARMALMDYAKARSIEETLRPVCTQK